MIAHTKFNKLFDDIRLLKLEKDKYTVEEHLLSVANKLNEIEIIFARIKKDFDNTTLQQIKMSLKYHRNYVKEYKNNNKLL